VEPHQLQQAAVARLSRLQERWAGVEGSGNVPVKNALPARTVDHVEAEGRVRSLVVRKAGRRRFWLQRERRARVAGRPRSLRRAALVRSISRRQLRRVAGIGERVTAGGRLEHTPEASRAVVGIRLRLQSVAVPKPVVRSVRLLNHSVCRKGANQAMSSGGTSSPSLALHSANKSKNKW